MNSSKDYYINNEKLLTYLLSESLSDQTIHYYGGYYKKLEQVLEGVGGELTQDVINAFLAAYPNNVSRAFIKKYVHYLKKDLEIEIPRAKGKSKRRVTKIIPSIHIEMIRNSLLTKDMKWYLLFELTYCCALRRNEVVNIRLRDLNIEELSTDNKENVILIIMKPKFNKERRVVIPRMLFKAILLYARSNRISKDSLLFKSTKEQWWKVFHDTCIKLGFYIEEEQKTVIKGKNKKVIRKIAIYHPHSIRHTKSSEWRDNGVDLVSIQHRLGHEDISTTRRYISVENKREEDKWNKEYEEETTSLTSQSHQF